MAQTLNLLLHEPPVNSPVIDNGLVHADWKGWFTNLRSSFNQSFPIQTLNEDSQVKQVSVPKAPHLTQTQINALENIEDGSFVYNTTSGKFNFRESGAWVEE